MSMLILKKGHELHWGDLEYIESPLMAKRTVQSNHGSNIGGETIQNAAEHGLPNNRSKAFEPFGAINDKLDNGQVFFINTRTQMPVISRLEINPDGTAKWTLNNGPNDMFLNSLGAALHRVQVPKQYGVLRDEPAKKTDAKPKDKAKPQKLLTIAKIARKLRQIEGGSRYEEACFFASKIGWEGICGLVEVGHPENDPNLMPSRYMILPGASDDELRKKGNLNNFPHPLHKNSPKQMSVYNLKQFLILGDYLKGDKPYWQTQEQHTQEELDQLKEDGGIETSELSALTGSAEMDSDVAGALSQFLGKQTLPDPAGGTSYTIRDGDTLSAIAEENDFPNWQSIWQNNKHIIKNPDLIFPGDEIELPDLRNDELEPWFHEFDNGQAVWGGSTHYQFPASYFSLTLADRNGSEIKEKTKSEFQGYLATPHLFYCFNIQNSKEIQVLMPVCDSVSAGFKQNEFVADGITLEAFENVLYGDKKTTSSTGDFDAEDDEALTPDNVELV